MSTSLINEAKNLPLTERIELIEALWESIAQEGYEPPITPAQAEELDRRLAAHQQNPHNVVSWDNIRANLKSK